MGIKQIMIRLTDMEGEAHTAFAAKGSIPPGLRSYIMKLRREVRRYNRRVARRRLARERAAWLESLVTQ